MRGAAFVLLIIVVCLCSNGQAQSHETIGIYSSHLESGPKDVQAEPDIIWHTQIGGQRVTAPFEIAILNDSKNLALLSTANFANTVDLLTEEGKAIWDYQSYDPDSAITLRGCYEEAGTIKLYGNVQNSVFFPSRSFIYSWDLDPSDGREAGRGFNVDTANRLLPGVLRRISDGSWINIGSNLKSISVQICNQSKAIEHQSLIEGWPISLDGAGQILPLRSGDLLLAGTGSVGVRTMPWLAKIDANGDSIWSYKATNFLEDSTIYLTYSSAELLDGSILTLVNPYALGSETTNIHLLHLTKDGEFISFKKYDNLRNTFGASLTVLQDGSIAIAGYISLGGSRDPDNFYLMHLAYDGSLIKDYEWGNLTLLDHLSTIKQASDGGVLVAGLTEGGENQIGAKRYIAKINLATSSVARKQDDARMVLSPNPAREELRVELPSGFGSQVMTVFDNAGREILRMAAKDRLNVSSLANGVYQLMVSDGERVLLERFVIQR